MRMHPIHTHVKKRAATDPTRDDVIQTACIGATNSMLDISIATAGLARHSMGAAGG